MAKNCVRHSNKIRGFVQITNEAIFDQNLSDRALVLYLKILALSSIDNWEFNTSGLATITGWSRDSVQKKLNELEERGYLLRTQPREGGKFAKLTWHIFETPVRVKRTGEVYELESAVPGVLNYDLPNFFNEEVLSCANRRRGAQDPVRPETGCTESGAPDTIKYIINTTNQKIKNNINSECGAGAPRATGTDNRSISKTGGVGEALAESTPEVLPPVSSVCASTHEPDFNFLTEKELKTLKKKYKSAFVEYALELSKDKEKPDVYAKALLRDWKKQKLQSIQEVQRYVASFEDEKAPALTIKPYTGKARRVEQTPDWLNQEQPSYDANRQFTVEEQQRVARMQQLQSNLLDHQAIANAEAKLPF